MPYRILITLLLLWSAAPLAHAEDKCSAAARECALQIREMLEGRRYLGVVFEETRHGIRIRKVVEDSPADHGGLRKDDLILAINGRSMSRADAKRFKKVLQEAREKQDGMLSVVVSHYGQIRRLRARLGELPEGQIEEVVARHLREAHGETANGQ